MSLARPRPALITALVILGAIAIAALAGWRGVSASAQARTGLRIAQDTKAGTITVHRAGRPGAIVTQNAPPDARPYIHPIAAPDGKGVLTEFSPEHHKHQTGLYWGFTRLNGRDYFHNRQGDYWRRVSATVTQASGDVVRWQTVYDLLDAAGNAVLTETQRWSVREDRGRFLLDLEWRGDARVDVTIGKYDYGGLFLRMPWKPGMRAEVVNAARQRNARAEGQRAMWIDVAMQVEGRDDLAHVALFDHPDNAGYPLPWRVDDQFGVGTARARNADWTITKGNVEVIRHRLVAYTGTLDDVALTAAWSEYSGHRSTYATQALWGIAQREGREEKFLTPEQAAAAMTMVPGYAVKAWAGEPMIQQPMAFCWDDRGASGSRRTSTTRHAGADSRRPATAASSSWKTRTTMASPTAARFSWRASSFRQRSRWDSMACTSARRQTFSSCPIGTATTRQTLTRSKCGSPAGAFAIATRC